MGSRGRTWRAIWLAAALAWPEAAWSESPEARENAQALYKAGNDARDAGDLKTARARYTAAYALAQTPVIALALARADSRLGLLIEARQTALGVEKIPIKPAESDITVAARAQAAAFASELAPRIPTVLVTIAIPDGAAGPSVVIDDVAVPDISLHIPTRVNPGRHVAVATVGNARREASFEVAETEAKEIDLEYPIALPPPSIVARAPTIETLASRSRSSSLRAAGYSALALGGAGVVVTAIFGVLAENDRSALKSACGSHPQTCPSSTAGDISGLHTNALVSDVALGVAIAGVGVGTVLLLKDTLTRPPIGAEAWIGLGQLGLRGAF